MPITAPPKPKQTKRHRSAAWNGEPDHLDPAYPTKTAFRFPPGRSWGFLFWS
jgi:hypothetical protein